MVLVNGLCSYAFCFVIEVALAWRIVLIVIALG